MKQLKMTKLAVAFGLVAGTAGAQDWSGFYAGVSATTGGADLDIVGLPVPYDMNGSVGPGIFAGYNYVLPSNLVLGGELSYTDMDASNFPVHPFYAEGLIQARGRIGFASGNVMPYLALGVAKGDVGVVGGPSTSETGIAFGLGAEMLVGNNMSVRAEYSQVRFDGVGENVFFAPGVADVTYETLTIGAAWHF